MLVIVDGLLEMSQATRNKIRPVNPEFAANALLVTSRLEESLDGVTKTILHPVRVQGNRLSSFMDAYLAQKGTRAFFEDTEFFAACSRLSMMIGDRDITVLLVKLYADQMIASKDRAQDRLPETIPDLMLEYLNELNRREADLDDRVVHAVAKAIAWECLRQNYRPMPARIDAVLEALGGSDAAHVRIRYLEQKLRLVQTVGAARDQAKFALDPLSEYLAGLYVVEHYRDNEQLWREFFAKADGTLAGPELINGFLLAVRDCCVAKGPDANVSPLIAEELTYRVRSDPEITKAQLTARDQTCNRGLNLV